MSVSLSLLKSFLLENNMKTSSVLIPEVMMMTALGLHLQFKICKAELLIPGNQCIIWPMIMKLGSSSQRQDGALPFERGRH